MKNLRIGQTTPSSSTTMEIEISVTLASRYVEFPDGRLMFHSARIRMMHVISEELKNTDMTSDRYALELGDARYDAMVCACLVVITSQDHGYHRVSQECLVRTTEQNNVPTSVLSSVGTLTGAVHVQGYKKIAVITPHMRPLMQTATDHIESSGIEVIDSISLEVSDNPAAGRFDPINLVGHADRSNISGANAVVLSVCAQMSSLSSIQVVEDRLDRPVFSVATSMVYQMLKMFGLKAKVPSAGYLLSGAF